MKWHGREIRPLNDPLTNWHTRYKKYTLHACASTLSHMCGQNEEVIRIKVIIYMHAREWPDPVRTSTLKFTHVLIVLDASHRAGCVWGVSASFRISSHTARKCPPGRGSEGCWFLGSLLLCSQTARRASYLILTVIILHDFTRINLMAPALNKSIWTSLALWRFQIIIKTTLGPSPFIYRYRFQKAFKTKRKTTKRLRSRKI